MSQPRKPRRYRPPSIIYPDFEYEKYGLIKKDLPHFIIVVLDNIYMPPERKEDFFERFIYPYLTNEEFKRKVWGQVLVFEGTKYIDTSYNNNFLTMGDPNGPKHIIDIGEMKIWGNMYMQKVLININIEKFKINLS